MTVARTLLVVLLSYLVSLSSAGYQQIVPTSYEFNSRDYSLFQEPLVACPGNNTRPDRRRYTVCNTNGTIRPKLMDCDVEGDSYHLNDDKFQFWFTYAQALSSSIIIIHYECVSTDVNYKITTKISNGGVTEMPLDCERRHHGLFYNSTETYHEVRLVFISHGGGQGIHLKEVQHFIEKEDSLDDCGTLNCCTITDVCTETGQYTCLCPNGFYGINCQNDTCSNTGVFNTYNCTICPNDYTGRNCEIKVSATSPAVPKGTPPPVPDMSDDSSSSSLLTAAIAGVLFALVAVAVTVSVSVVALVCYRRKNSRKSHKPIQQIVHSNPSIGQNSTSPLPDKKNGALKYAPEHDDSQEYTGITHLQGHGNQSDSQQHSPSIHPTIALEDPTINPSLTYDTIDDANHTSPDPYYSIPAVGSSGYSPASKGNDRNTRVLAAAFWRTRGKHTQTITVTGIPMDNNPSYSCSSKFGAHSSVPPP